MVSLLDPLSLGVFFSVIFQLVLCFEEPLYGTTTIGGACKRDHHCIKNAFCRVQETCWCDSYYAPSPDRTTCLATSGLLCDHHETCETMSNGECRQGVCACKETFVLDINNSSNCISRPTRVNDRCQRNDECEDTLDRATCISGKCHCFTGHHFVNQTAKCIQSRRLYTSCRIDHECLLSEEALDALQCKNGECVCKEGDSRCSKGVINAPLVICIVAMLIQIIGL